ncbi:hypothetical protein D3C81_1921600 [compost metagenome]
MLTRLKGEVVVVAVYFFVNPLPVTTTAVEKLKRPKAIGSVVVADGKSQGKNSESTAKTPPQVLFFSQSVPSFVVVLVTSPCAKALLTALLY